MAVHMDTLGIKWFHAHSIKQVKAFDYGLCTYVIEPMPALVSKCSENQLPPAERGG